MVVYLRGRITTAEDEGFVAVFGRSNTQLLVYFLFFVFVFFFFWWGEEGMGSGCHSDTSDTCLPPPTGLEFNIVPPFLRIIRRKYILAKMT